MELAETVEHLHHAMLRDFRIIGIMLSIIFAVLVFLIISRK